MTSEKVRCLYAGLIVASFALVAFLRRDLVSGAASATLSTVAQGGAARWKVLGAAWLFGSILWTTVKTASAGGDWRRDLPVVAAGAVLGYLAEAWGTRAGLWVYYTGETPPWWIIPAWPLGALVVSRIGEKARERFSARLGEAGHRLLYAVLGAVCMAVMLVFLGRRVVEPASLAYLALVAVILFLKADPRNDLSTLCAGLACVFFADLWGTTNFCWSYYTQGPGGWGGIPLGIAFGMTFDSVLVLGVLRFSGIVAILLPRMWYILDKSAKY